jgi:hypothetical protein
VIAIRPSGPSPRAVQPSLFLEFGDDAFRRVHRHVAVVQERKAVLC